MGTAILRGISTGLLVTLLTLLGGVIWETMGLGGLKVGSLVDVGLFLSCLIGGFRAAREGGHWVIGAAAGLGYVAVSTLLLALFAPVSAAGVVQLLAEGALLGGLGGVIGTGFGGGIKVRPAGNRESWRDKSYHGKDWTNDFPDLANEEQNQVNSLQDQDNDYRTDAINPDRTHPWWEEERGGIKRIG